jgi:hypothetical protein
MADENERAATQAERVSYSRDDDEVEGHRLLQEPADPKAVRRDDDEPEVEGHRFGHSPAERVASDPNRAS